MSRLLREVILKAVEILKDYVRLCRKFDKTKDSCPSAYHGILGRDYEVTCCGRDDYDIEQAPNRLCVFDFCPIIQEEYQNGQTH